MIMSDFLLGGAGSTSAGPTYLLPLGSLPFRAFDPFHHLASDGLFPSGSSGSSEAVLSDLFRDESSGLFLMA